MGAPPVWLGKWSSLPQPLIQELIAHLHMEHPKSNQLKNMALFPDPSCTFSALYLVSAGVRGFAHSLVTHKCQQGLPDLLMPQGMQREASYTGTAAWSQRQSLGLLPCGPLLQISAAHLDVHHCCCHVLHPSASFWVCGSPASTSNSADGWYKRGL